MALRLGHRCARGLARRRTGRRSRRAQRRSAHALDGSPAGAIDSIGAYFAYVRAPVRGRTRREVAEGSPREHGMLGLPGSYFGAGQEGILRIAFANADVAAIALVPDRLKGFTPSGQMATG